MLKTNAYLSLTGLSISVLMLAMAPASAQQIEVTNGDTELFFPGADSVPRQWLLNDGGVQMQVPMTITGQTFALGAGGGWFDTNSNDTTLGTVLSGSGAFTKSGNGTLTLTGMNTYNGAATVTAGTLALSGQGRLNQATSLSISSGATLDVSAATAVSLNQLNGAGSFLLGSNYANIGGGNFSGVISGSGGFNVGPGTMILTGNNTFTGSVGIGSTGTLKIGNGGTTGTVLGSIANYGNLIFDRSDLVTYNGLITANGAITFTGGGNYVLTQSSSASGALTIDAGTTVQWGTGAAGGWIGAGSLGITVGPLTNNGTLIINRSSDRVYQGQIGGTGDFVKLGAGMVGLSNTSTYTGKTDVKAGTLLVSGSIAQSSLTTVYNGAMLTGGGTVGNTNILTGGILAPGNSLSSVNGTGKISSIGTMNVAGNLAMSGGATLDIKVNDQGASDKVNVSGNLVLDPMAVVRVRALNGTDDGSTYASNTSYTIASAAGGISGQFNSTVDEQFAFLDAGLSYTDNDVKLLLSRNDVKMPDVAITPNQQTAAAALSGFSQSDPVYQQTLGLTQQQAQQAYESISGEVHASGQQVLDQTFALFTSSLIGDIVGGASGSKQISALGYVEVPASSIPGLAAIEDAEQTAILSNSVWISPLGGLGTVKGNGNAAAIKWGAGGLAMGYEGEIVAGEHKLTYGAALGYLASKGEVTDRSSRYETQGGFTGVYGAWTDGTASLSGNVAYGANHVSTQRDIVVGAINRTANANYWAHTVGGGLEASYGFKLTEEMTIKPVGTLDINWAGHNGATETGAGSLNAVINPAGDWNVNAGIGGEIEYKTALADGAEVTFTLRGMWQHALTDTNTNQNLALAGNTAAQMNVNGASSNRDRLLVGVGVEYAPTENTNLALKYTGVFSQAQAAHMASGTWSIKF